MALSQDQVNTLFQYMGETRAGIQAINQRLDQDATERRAQKETLDETLTFIREDHAGLATKVSHLEHASSKQKGFLAGISFVMTTIVGLVAWLIDLFFKVKN